MSPTLAVSAAIFKEGEVLIVQRAQQPWAGHWSFPGGKVVFGESLEGAVLREVKEETGLDIEVKGLAGYRDILGSKHYVVLCFAAVIISGLVVLNSELCDFRWVVPSLLPSFHTTDGLEPLAASALRLIL